MILSRNKINYVHPFKPHFFFYIKWSLRGSKLYKYVFVMKQKDFAPKRRFFPFRVDLFSEGFGILKSRQGIIKLTPLKNKMAENIPIKFIKSS